MTLAFYLSSAIAIIATLMVITSRHPVHALMHLVVSLLAMGMIFYTLGAEFVALLEVIVYAGAIMVLFVFMIMMLNLGPDTVKQESNSLPGRIWVGPMILCGMLMVILLYVFFSDAQVREVLAQGITAREVGRVMLDKYYLGVEFASMILLAGMVGAYHLGKRDTEDEQEKGEA